MEKGIMCSYRGPEKANVGAYIRYSRAAASGPAKSALRKARSLTSYAFLCTMRAILCNGLNDAAFRRRQYQRPGAPLHARQDHPRAGRRAADGARGHAAQRGVCGYSVEREPGFARVG